MNLNLRRDTIPTVKSFCLPQVAGFPALDQGYVITNAYYPFITIRREGEINCILRIGYITFLRVLENLGVIAKGNTPLRENSQFYINYKICLRYRLSLSLIYRTELSHDVKKGQLLFDVVTFAPGQTLSHHLWVPIPILMNMLLDFGVFTSKQERNCCLVDRYLYRNEWDNELVKKYSFRVYREIDL